MSGEDVRAADELEARRQLKARYRRFLDTKDVESWRNVFTADEAVTPGPVVSKGGTNLMMAPALSGPDGPTNFVPMVMAGLQNAATRHPTIQESHTTELALTSATTATGMRALEDWRVFGDGRELQNLSCHG
jgi:hypothetical protein